jgi:hypothetical protein
MTIKGRLIRLERRQIERDTPVFYFVASEAVATREGIPLSQCLVTDDPEDDPPLPCTQTHEERVFMLEEEDARNAST